MYQEKLDESAQMMNLLQLTPSPEYPALQEQLKLPSVFVQFAFISQLWVSRTHSLISVKKMKEKTKINKTYEIFIKVAMNYLSHTCTVHKAIP